jgi:hypothetical protein
MRWIALLGIVSSLIGCASSTQRLQLATCATLPCTPGKVQIRAIQRRAMTVEWEAVTSQGVYICHADDMIRLTVCR